MGIVLFFTALLALHFCSAASGKPLHVSWAAPFHSGGGYCSEAMDLTQGLAAVSPNTTLRLIQHGDSYNPSFMAGLPPTLTSFIQAHMRTPLPRHATHIAICHSEPGAWNLPPQHPANWGPECPSDKAHYRIGRTMFETDRLPSGWASRMEKMDELWVPSAFMRDILLGAGVSRAKVKVLGEPVDAAGVFSPENGALSAAAHPTLPPRGAACARGLGTAACPYRFLSCGKWERRKGFDVLLAAYVAAFAASASANVELYILTSSYHGTGDFEGEIARMLSKELTCTGGGGGMDLGGLRGGLCLTPQQVAARPPIRLLSGIPQLALPGVFASVDAVVQPSRGEGWGRPHVEGMAMGLPLVSTFWSGTTAYMTANNSFPVGIGPQLLPIPDGPFQGHLQGEPDGSALRDALAALVADGGAEGRRRGAVARQDMLEKFSLLALGRELAGLLEKAQARAEVGSAGSAAHPAGKKAGDSEERGGQRKRGKGSIKMKRSGEL